VMHLPSHPDTLYEYIKALRECGLHDDI
jgi:hypothetical protein